MLIRVFDLESTGDAPPEHGVCELGWCDVRSTKLNLACEPAMFEVEHPASLLVNPGRPIPPETAAIHHIIDADVVAAPRFKEAFDFAMKGERPDALAAHSAKFERVFISDEMTGGLPWVCTYKCALRLWPELPVHSNQAIRYARNPIGLERALSLPAHRAGPDAYVTAFHVRDLLDMADLPSLIKWSGEPALQVTCHIGNQRGQKWADVDSGFLQWILNKDFDEDVLFTARTELTRRRAEGEEGTEDDD